MLDSRSDVTDDRKSLKEVPATVDSAISMGDESLAVSFPNEKNAVEIPDAHTLRIDTDDANTSSESSEPKDESADLESRAPDLSTSPTSPPSQALGGPDRPEAIRQSSKVQELVHMYDGIARRKDPPAEPLLTGPRIVLVGSDGVMNTDEDIQDEPTMHEVAQSEPEPRPEPLEEHEDKEPENDDTDHSASDSPKDQQEIEPAIESSEKRHEPSNDAKVPSIPYAYDLEYLDDLFPSTPTPPIDPEPVPDVIIDDTFASISERKAWYRMSRRGPMRQHNQGNDNDYVRLDWRSSEVRSRTLHIVRRWMEEDSIAGRVVLGRRTGPAGPSMFNWDSQAPQVQIGDLFGKKEHKRSISVASRGSRGSLPSPTSATFAWSGGHESPAASMGKPSLDEPKRNNFIAPPPTMASPTIASFGWNSEPRDVGTTNGGFGEKNNVAPTQKALAPVPTAPTRLLPSLDTVVANGSTKEPLGAVTIEETEDEDEWGEMVSSPTWPSEPLTHDKKAVPILSDHAVTARPDPPQPIDAPVTVAGSEPHGVSTLPEAYPTNRRETAATLPERFSGAHENPGLDLEAPVMREVPIVPAELVEPGPWDSFGGPGVALSPKNEEPEVILKTQPQSLTEGEEAVVQQLLKNIPDMSYMLR
jgi:hypothetical protein